ncbi:MAG TPA: hypothetical protein VJ695_06765 [Nitrososphaera sp.]|nr:hypothetical protein [Nitrososphaera sp.]
MSAVSHVRNEGSGFVSGIVNAGGCQIGSRLDLATVVAIALTGC